MKKFAQTAVLIAAIAGLSACATSNDGSDMGRTAGKSGSFDSLSACNERVRRLEEMNRSCYRK